MEPITDFSQKKIKMIADVVLSRETFLKQIMEVNTPRLPHTRL